MDDLKERYTKWVDRISFMDDGKCKDCSTSYRVRAYKLDLESSWLKKGYNQPGVSLCKRCAKKRWPGLYNWKSQRWDQEEEEFFEMDTGESLIDYVNRTWDPRMVDFWLKMIC